MALFHEAVYTVPICIQRTWQLGGMCVEIHEQVKIARTGRRMVRIYGPWTVTIGDSIPNGQRTPQVRDPSPGPIVKRLDIHSRYTNPL